jgi:hypothetical protein
MTLPEVAPVGTVTPMADELQLVTVAGVPLKLTVPRAVPKFAPAIFTGVPSEPDVGDRLVMLGAGTDADTVNVTPLLARPPTVTTTVPVVAPAGTWATMLVALQLSTVATFFLNVTLLELCVDPNFVPVIVTNVPIGPLAGLRLAICGTLFLDCAPTVAGINTIPSNNVKARDRRAKLRDLNCE